MTHKVLIDAIGTDQGIGLRAKQAVLVLVGIAILAIAAKIRVPMWPVPITMGTFAVLGLGAAYGARLGLVTILGYMLVGAVGFDVFAGSSAQNAGFGYMIGGTGGYLVGYVLAVLTLGTLASRGWDRSVAWMALAMLIGNVAIYLPGLLWLNTMPYAESMSWTVSKGLTPFLVGDLVKLVLAAMILPAAWKFVGRARG